jgi:hypothetical protein
MGLNTSSWPKFSWLDGLPGPKGRYEHWGYFMPQNILEPNNIFPPENCVGANFTEGFDDAWAWSDTKCAAKFPYMCKAQALGAFYYTSWTSNATYVFNNTPVTQGTAALACKEYGGFAVSFKSLEEQQEVEAYFVSTGKLLPEVHKGYWLGLKATTWPSFGWIDKTAGAFNPGVYNNWGNLDGVIEPNNMMGPELCVVANYSQAQRDAWGWSDTNCGGRYPYMCKVVGTGGSEPPQLTSNITGNVFQLYLNRSTQAAAEATCQAQGGHLAVYLSDYEQTEIESTYTQLGYLIPSYHRTYWMGIQRQGKAGMRWMDGSLPGPSSGNYQHWGTYKPGGLPEPNNLMPPENCVVANYSEAYGIPPAYGWADTQCNNTNIFICRRLTRKAYYYNSTRGSTFIYNTTATRWQDAEQSCRDNGGHLVTHTSFKEQAEVESYYIGAGLLLPSYHRFYWMGLKAELWPTFSWADRSPGPNGSTYEHWGRYMPGNDPEPNNYELPPENCGGANYTEAFGNPLAWGWADYSCDQAFTFMCKMASGWQLQQPWQCLVLASHATACSCTVCTLAATTRLLTQHAAPP